MGSVELEIENSTLEICPSFPPKNKIFRWKVYIKKPHIFFNNLIWLIKDKGNSNSTPYDRVRYEIITYPY